ncbi:MAG: hypothetical protein EPO64_04145 [Nitrospirae bacterium]|nr:MAG: hypothetical protein EPO64_04145 [Nitrospirota bacterium]
MVGLVKDRGLALGALILSCAVLGGCGQYPVTDGFSTMLPQRQERLLVWSANVTAAATAATWLQKQGLTVTEPVRVQQVFSEQKITLTNSPSDDAQMLRAAKMLGLSHIVYVDVSAVEVGMLKPPFSPPLATYIVGVAIRGVQVESGAVVWSGTARYRGPVTERDDYVANLTCQALATAWGLRPPGEHPIDSQSMCSLGDREHVGASDGRVMSDPVLN